MASVATVSDLLIAKPRASAQQAMDAIVSHNPARAAFLRDYLTALAAICATVPLAYELLVAQAIHETAWFTSAWWMSRGNPAGIGVTGDPAQDAASPTFATGQQAARAHAAHMLLYCTGQISGGSGLVPADDPRYSAYVAAFGNTARVAKLADLGSGNWAGEPKPNYAAMIVPYAQAILNQPVSILPPPPTPHGGPMATTKQYIAGLPQGTLDLSFPVIQDIIPYSTFNRPGRLLSGTRKLITHETDNTSPGADALMHGNWLRNGPVDQYGNREYVSVHFFVDHTGVRQSVPITEVTYQAADGPGPGNESCISMEICVPNDGDYDGALRVAEELWGKLGAALGMPLPDYIGLHYDYNSPEHLASLGLPPDPNRHHCPNIMLNTGRVNEFKMAATAYAKGSTPVSTPAPAPAPAPGPSVAYPEGMDKGVATQLFGSYKAADGKTYGYAEGQPLSSLWLSSGSWGRLAYVGVYVDSPTITRMVWQFSDGQVYARPNASAPVVKMK